MLPGPGVRGDGRHQADNPLVVHGLGQRSQPPPVGVPVLRAEAQGAGQLRPHRVAVHEVHLAIALL